MSRRSQAIFAVLLLLPWVVVLLLWRSLPSAAPSSTATGPVSGTTVISKGPSANSGATTVGKPGPWGTLEYSRILIEPPENFIPPDSLMPRIPSWVFPNCTAAQLDELWQAAQLTAAHRDALQRVTKPDAGIQGFVVLPPVALILEMPAAARERIYTFIGRFPQNQPQHDPFRIHVAFLDDWLDADTLPAEAIALTRKLTYRRGETVFFADHDLVLPRLNASADRVRLIKNLSRKSALLVELSVPHNADIEQLARYWGNGRRSKDIRPLLDSLAQRPNGGSIDLIHLLPPFARSLLYTYPETTGPGAQLNRDCHWTSLNFFNPQPDDRFADTNFSKETLLANYYMPADAPALGDILVFVEGGERGIHSCVYVADDIVFTKNGAAFSVPWSLAPLSGVLSLYTADTPLEVRRYRAK